MESDFLQSARRQFDYYKLLGEKTMERLTEEQLLFAVNEESNSIATIVKHLHGNMKSRWTDFLTSDGEKPDRNRDQEFESAVLSKQQVIELWQQGWKFLSDALSSLNNNELDKIVYIRHQGHTVMEAINRQLAHYPYHVGQIVFIGKLLLNTDWQSLSIPKGSSQQFNAEKFSVEKHREHFTEDVLKTTKKNGNTD